MLKDHDSSSNWCGETHVVERRRGWVLGEVDGLEVDDVEVVGEAGEGSVDLTSGVAELHAVDVVVDSVVNHDSKHWVTTQGRVDPETGKFRYGQYQVCVTWIIALVSFPSGSPESV